MFLRIWGLEKGLSPIASANDSDQTTFEMLKLGVGQAHHPSILINRFFKSIWWQDAHHQEELDQLEALEWRETDSRDNVVLHAQINTAVGIVEKKVGETNKEQVRSTLS